MPELPEVETTVKGLKLKVLNRTFVDVWSDWKKIIKKPESFIEFKKEIKNKKVIKIYRRAKNVIFELSGGYSLLIHQKMTGHLLVGDWHLASGDWHPVKDGPLNDPYNRFIHIMFFLDNSLMMGLSDVRKFAKIELWKSNELKRNLEKIGPEPLEKNFTFEKFKESLLWQNSPSLKLRRGKVKQILMDPLVIAGIGNIYASEALWQAKIYPEKNVADLSKKELISLYKGIKKVLTLGVKLGGESFSDYRKPDGTKGSFSKEKKVYKREGQKCLRCKTLIKRISIGGRGTFFCSFCQKL